MSAEHETIIIDPVHLVNLSATGKPLSAKDQHHLALLSRVCLAHNAKFHFDTVSLYEVEDCPYSIKLTADLIKVKQTKKNDYNLFIYTKTFTNKGQFAKFSPCVGYFSSDDKQQLTPKTMTASKHTWGIKVIDAKQEVISGKPYPEKMVARELQHTLDVGNAAHAKMHYVLSSDKRYYFIVMWNLQIDLLDYINDDDNFNLSTIELIDMALSIVDAYLETIHSTNIVHLDIKPENITFYNKQIFFIDFGLSQKAGTPKKIGGTEEYIDPSLYDEATSHIEKHNDLYSLGVVLRYVLGFVPNSKEHEYFLTAWCPQWHPGRVEQLRAAGVLFTLINAIDMLTCETPKFRDINMVKQLLLEAKTICENHLNGSEADSSSVAASSSILPTCHTPNFYPQGDGHSYVFFTTQNESANSTSPPRVESSQHSATFVTQHSRNDGAGYDETALAPKHV